MRILIVDDCPLTRKMLRNILRVKNASLVIEDCEDGSSAIALVEASLAVEVVVHGSLSPYLDTTSLSGSIAPRALSIGPRLVAPTSPVSPLGSMLVGSRRMNPHGSNNLTVLGSEQASCSRLVHRVESESHSQESGTGGGVGGGDVAEGGGGLGLVLDGESKSSDETKGHGHGHGHGFGHGHGHGQEVGQVQESKPPSPRVQPFGCVLVDYSMPKMSGPETIRHLRRIGYCGVVVGVTGYQTDEEVGAFKASGADDVVVKPLKYEVLLEVLGRHRVGEEGV